MVRRGGEASSVATSQLQSLGLITSSGYCLYRVNHVHTHTVYPDISRFTEVKNIRFKSMNMIRVKMSNEFQTLDFTLTTNCLYFIPKCFLIFILCMFILFNCRYLYGKPVSGKMSVVYVHRLHGITTSYEEWKMASICFINTLLFGVQCCERQRV